MNDERIRQICKDRLAMWTDDLVGDHATPVLLVGIGHDHRSGEVVICTVQEMDQEKITLFLARALEKLLDVR